MGYRRMGGALVAACFLAMFLTSPAAHSGGPGGVRPGAGDAAPRFSATDLAGNGVSLEGILAAGNAVFLNFWGMRCANCITEIGYLNPMYERYASHGVVFLGVNVDGAPTEMLRRMMPNMPNVPKYPIIPDPEFKIPELYKMDGAPLSILIGKNGKITYRHQDFRVGDEKEIEKALRNVLDEKTGPR